MRTSFSPLGLLSIALVVGLTAFVWTALLRAPLSPGFYFLNVGQGDSALVVLENGTRVLIDAGPDGRVAKELETLFPANDRVIDIGIITHPELDHFGGYLDLLDRYEFGAIIVNGRQSGDAPSDSQDPWARLVTNIDDQHIPIITLTAGDIIRSGQANIVFLNPDAMTNQSAELNDTALVVRIETQGLRALFAGDIAANVESYLIGRADLRADILKVGHHGSKFSSSPEFLAAIQPKIAVISAGRGNHFGHPAPEALDRFATLDIPVFRTDEQGRLAVTTDGKTLHIHSQNP